MIFKRKVAGQPVSASEWNALCEAVEKLTQTGGGVIAGPGIKLTRLGQAAMLSLAEAFPSMVTPAVIEERTPLAGGVHKASEISYKVRGLLKRGMLVDTSLPGVVILSRDVHPDQEDLVNVYAAGVGDLCAIVQWRDGGELRTGVYLFGEKPHYEEECG